MCDVNWLLLLEYLKVFLGWPPMSFAIAILVIARFRGAIDNFLTRLVEGNIFGQVFKAVPPGEQQQEAKQPPENRLAKAAEAQGVFNAPPAAQQQLPPELANDPRAAAALAYVQSHPVETVIEYRRLLFNFNSERLFNFIYGTQIELLQDLASHPDVPATLAQLAKFHEQHQKLAGRTDYQLRDYVNFLVAYGVVIQGGTPEEQTYRIAQHGIEFLSYIKANYPTAWNRRAL